MLHDFKKQKTYVKVSRMKFIKNTHKCYWKEGMKEKPKAQVKVRRYFAWQ